MNDRSMTRRESMQKMVQFSIGAVLAGGMGSSFIPGMAFGEKEKSGWLVEGAGETPGYSIKELTRKVFDAAGGIKGFISPGDVVVIKPNISWARAPQLAATTNPEVLEAVIETVPGGRRQKGSYCGQHHSRCPKVFCGDRSGESG